MECDCERVWASGLDSRPDMAGPTAHCRGVSHCTNLSVRCDMYSTRPTGHAEHPQVSSSFALVLPIRLAVSVKWAHHSIMLVAFRPEGAVNAVVCHEWLVPSVCGLLPDFVGCA